MNNFFGNSKSIREKRDTLRQLSRPFKELVRAKLLKNVNDGLTALYRDEGHTILKTLKQWNKEGKSVRKGEHALCLWGKPEKRQMRNEHNGTTENDFYPLRFVFSNLQLL